MFPQNMYELNQEYRQRQEAYAEHHNQAATVQSESAPQSLVGKLISILKESFQEAAPAKTAEPVEGVPGVVWRQKQA